VHIAAQPGLQPYTAYKLIVTQHKGLDRYHVGDRWRRAEHTEEVHCVCSATCAPHCHPFRSVSNADQLAHVAFHHGAH
jgi:hypothetical protein